MAPEGAESESAIADMDSPQTLARRTITAAQWQTASSVVKGVLQFGVSVLLARLLTPTDFGLVALALVVVGFAQMVVDLGLGPAIVQHERLTDRHVRVSFTASTLIGLSVAVALLLAAPLFAPLLRSPSVPGVLRWLSLLFVFSGLGATARALLGRRLDFRGVFFTNLISYGVGYALVAVTLALLGFGVWSLVFGALVQALLDAAVSIGLVRHPLRPLLAGREIRDLLGFGLGVIANRSVVYASMNGDNFVVGSWLGAHFLGLYSRAFQLMMLPLMHLGSITWSILFAAYSQLRADRDRARRAYLKGVQLTALVIAPLMAGMAVAGPHLIVGLYGPQWAAATLPFQILCGVGLFRGVYEMTGALTHAFGKVYAEFRRQALYAVLVVAAALVGSRWGIAGVAVGMAGAVMFMYFAMAQLGVRITGCRWREFFAAQAPGVALALVVAATALGVRFALEQQNWSSGAILAAIITSCTAAVPVGLYLLPERVRPVDLFRSLDDMIVRLPRVLRLPIRRITRLSPEHAPS